MSLILFCLIGCCLGFRSFKKQALSLSKKCHCFFHVNDESNASPKKVLYTQIRFIFTDFKIDGQKSNLMDRVLSVSDSSSLVRTSETGSMFFLVFTKKNNFGTNVFNFRSKKMLFLSGFFHSVPKNRIWKVLFKHNANLSIWQ